MLKWIKSQINLKLEDDRVLWSSICTGWFFLLRSGEYLRHPGRPWDFKKVLCGRDVELRLQGRACELHEEPDEVIIRIRGSKTDQLNAGEVRNHYVSKEKEGLCVVRALSELRKTFPQRFGKGSEADQPLFKWKSGKAVMRTDVTAWLERAALSQGVPIERIGAHSLRIGGATALYHTTKDLDLVRRYGRWSSSAYNLYLWEANEQAEGVAASMASDDTTLMISQGLGADAVREAWEKKVGEVKDKLIIKIDNQTTWQNLQQLMTNVPLPSSEGKKETSPR
jgi:hypothetical protein